jgi:sulfur carrier protein
VVNRPGAKVGTLADVAPGVAHARDQGAQPCYLGATSVEIQVNGETRAIAAGTTVAGLVDLLGLRREHVAVERNREIVPRSEHAATVLEAGDRLEIVTFVGGG